MDSLVADYSSSSSEDERDTQDPKTTVPAVASTANAGAPPKPTAKEAPKMSAKPRTTIDIDIFSKPLFGKSTNPDNSDDDDDDDDDGPTEEARALRARDALGQRDISRISSFSDLLPPPKNPAGSLATTKRKMVVPLKFRKSAAGPRATPWDSSSSNNNRDNSGGTDPKRAKILADCAFALANAPVPDFGDEAEGATPEAPAGKVAGEAQRNEGTMWDYSRPAQRSTSRYVYSTSDAGVREKELERVEHTTEETALDLSSDYLRSLRTEEEEMLQNNPAFVQTIAAPTFHLGSQSRRKHQLKYLAVDAYYKEQSLAIKRANGKKSKAETQSKYGW